MNVREWLESDRSASQCIDANPLAGLKKRERVISESDWLELLSLAPDSELRDLLAVTWETIVDEPLQSIAVPAPRLCCLPSIWTYQRPRPLRKKGLR